MSNKKSAKRFVLVWILLPFVIYLVVATIWLLVGVASGTALPRLVGQGRMLAVLLWVYYGCLVASWLLKSLAPRGLVISRRELSSYFYSPIAYVAMTLFLLATGFLFWSDFQPGQIAGMRSLFEWMVWLLVFVIPVLSMGLMSQEWSTGTVETLMTAPLSEIDVIMGKFLGSLCFFLVLLAPTVVYVILLGAYSRPSFDVGPIVSGYVGIVLVGALFIAIGLFCSSLTRSQVVAAVAAAAILFIVTIIPKWASEKATLPKFWRTVADQLVFRRYADFSRGVLDTGHLVFFIAATAVFLFLSVKVLESRRWK